MLSNAQNLIQAMGSKMEEIVAQIPDATLEGVLAEVSEAAKNMQDERKANELRSRSTRSSPPGTPLKD